MNLKQLTELSFKASYERGWWNDETEQNSPFFIACKFALIHSEITEAMEGFRRDSMDDKLPHRKSVEVELADALLRIFDLAGRLDLDLEGALKEKMKFNETRWDHDLKARRIAGGKKF